MNDEILTRTKSLMKWYEELSITDIITDTKLCKVKNTTSDTPNLSMGGLREKKIIKNQQTLFSKHTTQMSDAGIIKNAQNIASKCNSFKELYQSLTDFQGLDIKNTATNLVFSDGNNSAPLMLIGEAPGRDEDLQGKPFVGKSGQLLDRILHAIGLERHNHLPHKSVFISNTIFWRPPGNRKPSEIETMTCKPFIEKIIELASPKIIIFLGATAAQTLLETTTGIMRLRGEWGEYVCENKKKNIKTMPTFHPAFLLRQPSQKNLLWKDFLKVKKELDKIIKNEKIS